MEFPILQHNFKYVGMNQLSLQHQFIYIFETFIFKYKKDIFLTDIEQDKLSKKYTKLFLNNLGKNVDKNIFNNKNLDIGTQEHIIKNISKHKNINNPYKNTIINKNKILLNDFDSIKYINKMVEQYFLYNKDNIKNIKIENSNKEFINIEDTSKIIIKSNKTRQLIIYPDYKKILKNKSYKNLFNYRIVYIEKIYKTKQVYNFVHDIIKNFNSEKELLRFFSENLIKKNDFNKFIFQFTKGDSLQKIETSKKILKKLIKNNMQKIQNEKVLQKYDINYLYKIIKKTRNLQNENKYLLKKNGCKLLKSNNRNIITLNNQIINLYRVHYSMIKIYYNRKLLSRIYLKIHNCKTTKKLLNRIHLDIFKYNKIKYISKDAYNNVYKNKENFIGLNNLHRIMFLNKNHNLWLNNSYNNIFKGKYNEKYVSMFYSRIFRYSKNKYLRNFYKNILKYSKIIFLKKQEKYTKYFNSIKCKMFKKDCKPSILRINTKEKSVKTYNKDIYKNILKTKYIQNGIKNINKHTLKHYYVNRYNNDNIIKCRHINKYFVKESMSMFRILNHNKYLMKINNIYKNSPKKYLIKEETSIYLIENKYKFLEKSWINIYKIKLASKYLDIQRKWWILGHDDNLTDKLIIPNIDYPYETEAIIGVNKHPISSYETINYNDVNYGIKEIEVSIKIMQQMMNYLFVIWNCALIDWYKLEAKDAMPKIMDVFYYWINLDNVKEEMVQKESREDYLRVYRWFRWEAEKVWFKTKDLTYSEKNNGIKSVGMLLGNIIEYMKNHHYNIVPVTNSYNLTIMGNILITFTWQLPDYFRPIDKYKGKRKYYISNKTINKIRKKLFYQK